MTALTITPSDHPEPALYEALYKLHGHRCPMSIMGARLGFAARGALQAWQHGDRKLRARFHHQTCALDGIQIVTQCTLGNGNLEVVPEGQHLLQLQHQDDQRTALVTFTEPAFAAGRKYADLRQQVQSMPLDDAEQTATSRKMEDILHWLEVAPSIELVRVQVELGWLAG